MNDTKNNKGKAVTPWSIAQEIGRHNPHEDRNQSDEFCDWLLAMARGEKWPKPIEQPFCYLANRVIRMHWGADQFRQCHKDIKVVQKMNNLYS
jgi:hypothetical protein